SVVAAQNIAKSLATYSGALWGWPGSPSLQMQLHPAPSKKFPATLLFIKQLSKESTRVKTAILDEQKAFTSCQSDFVPVFGLEVAERGMMKQNGRSKGT
ncbi:hypothetical protein P7K49_014704, partial [Saguinus oedipus]